MDENTMGMPVAPAYGGFGGNSGFGFGADWAWIILLLVLCGGWNGGFGGFGGFGGDGLYPWMNNSNQISGGFRDQMINDNVTSIRGGIADISNQLCGGFAGVTATVTGAQNAVTQQMYTNQIADMERSFALQSQLSQCCCDNKAATADLKYTIATEACANRTASAANTQAILDKLCQLELDAKNDTISQLRSQINELSRTASQNAQTAAILANNEAQTAALEQYLAPVPRPAYVVQNPNCCGTLNGCGCGVV